MEKMKVSLFIDGKEKTFYSPNFISGRIGREAADLEEKYLINQNGKFEETQTEVLDIFVDFLCRAFGNQFTADEFYDGIDSRVMYKTIPAFFKYVSTGVVTAIGADTNDKEDSDPNE